MVQLIDHLIYLTLPSTEKVTMMIQSTNLDLDN